MAIANLEYLEVSLCSSPSSPTVSYELSSFFSLVPKTPVIRHRTDDAGCSQALLQFAASDMNVEVMLRNSLGAPWWLWVERACPPITVNSLALVVISACSLDDPGVGFLPALARRHATVHLEGQVTKTRQLLLWPLWTGKDLSPATMNGVRDNSGCWQSGHLADSPSLRCRDMDGTASVEAESVSNLFFLQVSSLLLDL